MINIINHDNHTKDYFYLALVAVITHICFVM